MAKKNVIIALLVFFLIGVIGWFLFPETGTENANNVTPAVKINNGQEVSDKGEFILKARKFVLAEDPDKYDTLEDSRQVEENLMLNRNNVALIIVDPWEKHPNDTVDALMKKNMKEKLSKLIEIARQNGILIIYSPNGAPVSELVKPQKNELVNSDLQEVDKYLKDNNINTVLMAGYSLNYCILLRPVGLITLKGAGYNIIVVRDASLAIETPETLEKEWHKESILNIVEYLWGYTTTVNDLKQALQKAGKQDS